jgi:lysozyme
MQEQGGSNQETPKTENNQQNNTGVVKIPESNKIDCHGGGSKDTAPNSVKDLIDNLKGTKSNVLSKEEVGKIKDWVKDNATGSKEDLSISKEGLNFIKEAEGGFKDKVYDANTGKDAKLDKEGNIIGSGDWTVGYGHKLTADEVKNQSYNKGITESQGEALLLKDVKGSVDRINKLANGELTQNQFDALVSFAYQQGNYNKSVKSVIALVNNGKLTEAADFIKNYGNKVSRREGESEMFKGKSYLPPQYYQNPAYYNKMHQK